MVAKIGQWALDLRRRLRRGNGTSLPQMDSDPDLPYLPGSSASRVSLTDAPPSNKATAGSLLFTRLPREIRLQILTEAFGGRTVHMDIRECPPLLPASERTPVTMDQNNTPHGGIGAELDRFSGWHADVLKASVEARVITPVDKKAKGPSVPAWQWWSCVCHRSLPYALKTSVALAPVWDDECVKGRNMYCQFFAGEAPDKCMIGCLGWLLTCRKAYAEGIHVLYSTNTIFLGRAKLIDGLLLSTDPSAAPPGMSIPPSIVPNAHLARLTRLEISWDFTLATMPFHDDEEKAGRIDMAACLMRLANPDAFPRLVSLVLSYGDHLYQRAVPPETCMDDLDEGLMNPLKRMAATFWIERQKRIQKRDSNGKLERVSPLKLIVELPTNTFEPMHSRVIKESGTWESGVSYFHRRCWWPSLVKVDKDGMPVGGGDVEEVKKQENEAKEDGKDEAEAKGKDRQNAATDDSSDSQTVDCGFWVKPGIESRLNFDYQGKPYRLGTMVNCF